MRPFPFEDGDLLPESENFKGGVASTSQEDADGSEETEYAFQHELTVVTCRNVASVDNQLKGAGSLILEAQNVLAMDGQMAPLDRKRKKKGSNQEWKSPSDPDARITGMKDGRTHLAHMAEHAVDLTRALPALTLQPANEGAVVASG
jgi:hypothetical protein